MQRLGVDGGVALAWARHTDEERAANAVRKASTAYLAARVAAKAARNKQKAAFRAAHAQHTYVCDYDEDVSDDDAPGPSVRKRVPAAAKASELAPAMEPASLACAVCSKPYARRGFLERHEKTCRGTVPAKRRRRDAAEDASGGPAFPREEASSSGPPRAPSARRGRPRATVALEDADGSDVDTSEAESESSDSEGSVANDVIILDDDYVDCA